MKQMALIANATHELQYRLDVFKNIPGDKMPKSVSPEDLRKFGIYAGAAGFWLDKSRTKTMTDDGTGVTVSALVTGKSYENDFDTDGVIYEYPQSKRPSEYDQSRIQATKTAALLKLPIFVVIKPTSNSKKRDVFLGWIEAWDDTSKLFLISFGLEAPKEIPNGVDNDDYPFTLTSSNRCLTTKSKNARERKFRFKIFRRYKKACMLCNMQVTELLTATHIRPISKLGSDDVRNGLLLCHLHHKAFKAGLFSINPSTYEITCSNSGPGKNELNIITQKLSHLPRKPHPKALNWHWNQWLTKNRT
jgi:hypothetical protein